LHRAVEQNRTDIVELLLANSADLEASDNCGLTPLTVAEYAGHYGVGNLLRKDKGYVFRAKQASLEKAFMGDGKSLHDADNINIYGKPELLVSNESQTEAYDKPKLLAGAHRSLSPAYFSGFIET
jgi:ankyrin repeat protein